MAIRKVLESAIHDSAPSNICTGLQRMGVNAQISARGRYEEQIGELKIRGLKIGGRESLGIIDIPEGPIRWINVRREYIRTGSGGTYNYFTDYGVPDPNLGPNWRGKHIKSIRVKNFPLFGRVVDLRWKGDELSQEVIRRLEDDSSIRDPIMRSRDILISAYPDHVCWMISTTNMRKEAPSREIWDCYQRIAKHLTE